MFGMGFIEILIIGVIAILFLGPDKLPQAMVEMAKFFRSVKRTVASAKESLEEEMHISEIKEEAMNYKKELTSASNELSRLTNLDEISSEIEDIKKEVTVTPDDISDSKVATPPPPPKPEVVTFEKKKRPKPYKKPKSSTETPKKEDS